MIQGNISQKIGIIGDGQLALMLAESLQKRGVPFLCLKQSSNSPMERRFPEETTADVAQFRKECDAFTLENEFLSVKELQELLEEKSSALFPNLASYDHFADKVSQRNLYTQLEIPSPQWMALTPGSDPRSVLQKFSFPFVVKASAGGYDGKGVRMVKNEQDFTTAVRDFGFPEGKTLLIEEKVLIKLELAQGFLRQSSGVSTLLPLVHTVQEDGVCNFVYYPAPVPPSIQDQISSILKKLMEAPLVGIFNFEFFVDQNDQVFINEGAPRPHNSQHLTIDASFFSQFDLLGLHLLGAHDVPRTVTTKKSAMINLLGKSSGPDYKLTLPETSPDIDVKPKLYHKTTCSPGRKMGHLNLVDRQGTHDLKETAQKIFREYEL